MKILAIRGQNLNSLEGDFALDLSEAPFRDAGLFAITGPTGAGKSTLLDAMCLALYRQAPRLLQSDKMRTTRTAAPAADDKAPGANEPGSFLRRGTVEGYAEVDFVAHDGKRYRARWEVYLARKKLGGTVKENWYVFDAEGKILAESKTGAKTRLEELVGLEFEQFSRSVLLPQGQFASFLQANEADRAELLERMTGTDLYGRLSIGAHHLFLSENEKRAALAGQLDQLAVLPDDERLRLDEDVAARARDVQEKDAAIKAQEAALQWFKTLAQRRRDEDHAREALAAADERRLALAPRAAELEAARRVESCRATFAEVDAAAEALARRRADEELRSAALAAKAEERVALRGVESEAQRRQDEAERALEEARPRLEQAVALEAQRAPLAAAGEREKTALASLNVERAENEKRRSTLELRIAQDAKQVEAARAWDEGHASLLPVVRDAGVWKERLEAYRAATVEEAGADAKRLGLEEEAEKLRARVQALVTEVEAIEVRRGAEAGRLEALEGGVRRLTVEASEDLRGAIEAVSARVRASLDLDAKLTEVTEAHAACGVRLKEAEERFAAADAHLARIDGRLAELTPQLDEARRAQERFTARHGLATYRDALEPGHPCPLCGSEEHPWSGEGPPPDPALDSSREVAEALEKERQDLEREKIQQGTWKLTGQGEIEREVTARSRTAERLASLGVEWSRGVTELAKLRALLAAQDTHAPRIDRGDADAGAVAIAGDVANAGAAAAAGAAATSVVAAVAGDLPEIWSEGRPRVILEALRATLVARAAGLAAARKRLDGLQKELREARARLDGLVAEGDRARSSRHELDKDSARLDTERRNVQAALDASREKRRKTIEQLEAAFPPSTEPGPLSGWRATLEKDPAAFLRIFQNMAGEWQERTDAARASEARLREDRALASGLAERLESITAEMTRVTSHEADLRRQLAELDLQRVALFGGRDPATVRTQLEDGTRQARTSLQASREKREAAELLHAELDKALSAARRSREDCEKRHTAATAAVAATVAGAGLDETEIRRLLALPPDRLAQLEREIDGANRARVAAATLLEERTRLVTEHATADAPGVDEATVLERLEASGVEVANARQAHALAVQEQTQDEERRRLRRTLGADLEKQELRWRTCQQLSALIGSADGKVFRRFAQSLNLDRLLEGANEHLAGFHPRYRLKRIKGTDLRLQVLDLEMGNEVRPVNTLSGGETFLVSLSLALGLSTLTLKNARIGSLFIDEGFGSLDSRSLDVALDALEALQVSGRQVGIISHVPGLAERVGAHLEVLPVSAGRSQVRVARGL